MHKQWYIFNKKYSQEEYRERVQELRMLPRIEVEARLHSLKEMNPHVSMRQSGSEDCAGDYISNTKGCYHCFDVEESYDSMYINNAINVRNCAEISFAGKHPLVDCYQVMSGISLNNCSFVMQCTHLNDSEYCEQCFYSHHLFGCVGLKNREFCIFNEQYSQEDYFKKVDELRSAMKKSGEYGEWFESPFPYEDTKAHEYEIGSERFANAPSHQKNVSREVGF
jgi:hypothetical protein